MGCCLLEPWLWLLRLLRLLEALVGTLVPGAGCPNPVVVKLPIAAVQADLVVEVIGQMMQQTEQKPLPVDASPWNAL